PLEITMTRPRVRKLDDRTSARVAAELDADIDDRSQTVVVGEGQSISEGVGTNSLGAKAIPRRFAPQDDSRGHRRQRCKRRERSRGNQKHSTLTWSTRRAARSSDRSSSLGA